MDHFKCRCLGRTKTSSSHDPNTLLSAGCNRVSTGEETWCQKPFLAHLRNRPRWHPHWLRSRAPGYLGWAAGKAGRLLSLDIPNYMIFHLLHLMIFSTRRGVVFWKILSTNSPNFTLLQGLISFWKFLPKYLRSSEDFSRIMGSLHLSPKILDSLVGYFSGFKWNHRILIEPQFYIQIYSSQNLGIFTARYQILPLYL